MSENFRALVRWLADLHAPLGRWSPLAATALFAGSSFLHFSLLRGLCYLGALVLVILIAGDIAHSFVDTQAYPDRAGHARLTLPMLAIRVLLSAVLAGSYTFLLFVGLGALVPLLLWPVLFVICALVAWRNVDLWYEQGAVFEEELKEIQAAENIPHSPLPQVFDGPDPAKR
ncbi:MAG TPA: hypothetical protein VFT65_01680 [Candidatus Angelobacter sp.]|nr:hypothetical protein [Candidatus Angelobacter sp.]